MKSHRLLLQVVLLVRDILREQPGLKNGFHHRHGEGSSAARRSPAPVAVTSPEHGINRTRPANSTGE